MGWPKRFDKLYRAHLQQSRRERKTAPRYPDLGLLTISKPAEETVFLPSWLYALPIVILVNELGLEINVWSVKELPTHTFLPCFSSDRLPVASCFLIHCQPFVQSLSWWQVLTPIEKSIWVSVYQWLSVCLNATLSREPKRYKSRCPQ